MKTKLSHPIARLLLAILMCLPICGSHAFAQEAESYAVFDEATNTLTFKHDTNKPTGAFALNEGDNAPGWYKPNNDGSNANIIKKVVFDASFANARPTNCHLWFYGCKNLTTIEGIEYLNTENVTSMSLMFSGCSALTTLNLSNFDTQSVTNMTGMFSDCRALTTLDVSNFNTQNVTDMSFMFFNCSAITTLDIAKFDTKNVTDMSFMFCSDPALTTIYASDKFVTTACEEAENMFAECANLVGAVPYDENKVGKDMANYTTGYFTDIASKIAESYAVFDEATNTLTFKRDTNKPAGAFELNEDYNAPGWYKPNGDRNNTNIIKKVIFDTSFANARPTSCYNWFCGCTELTTIEGIEYLNTENVTNMNGMFQNCKSLTTLDLSRFDTKNVTDMRGMFYACSALTTLDLSRFDTKNVTNISYMFDGCSALTTLDISNFNTQNVTNMSGMFWGCAALTTLDVSHFDTQNVTDMDGMFCNCSALTTLDVSNFDTKNVTNMNGMFSSCYALNTLDIANFDTQNVTDMSGMFNGCRALTTLDVSNFDTQNVTNMGYMFCSCYKLTTLDVSNFDTKNVTDMSWMFCFNPALTTIYASDKFVTTACEEDENMFAECVNLVGAVPYDENKLGKEMANYTTGYFTDIASKVAESYAVFDEATNTLTFKHDTKKPYGAFALNEVENAPGWYKPNDDGSNANIIKKVVFDASFANARPTSCCEWFNGCTDLTTIEGVEYLNTENVTDMSGMFWGCAALTTLDVSHFDTQNVTNMSYMFSDCSALTTLDVSNFNTQNVTNMYYMFSNCSALTTLDVSNFNTQNVTDMSGMFSDCRALTTLDVSNFNTQNVTDMSYMFFNCSAITTLDIANFDTKNVTDMSYMFYNCSALKTLDVSNFDTQNVTDMSWMFYNNSALTTIYASDKFVTTACKEDRNMFTSCDNLVGAVTYNENKVGKEMANYATGYFTDKAATGIDAPTVSDDTAAEYYDLQGRRLNAPQKGVNIVKRGKKTTKMLVK
ncbi:BspA family leucine-rich repeat surface protein [Leyella stercorea]|uniref:BspA family leucine-rich repeat surface protein n=1 Tax=Leyella stercorea TaxID=363265 RepID=UPI00242E3C92|nr:BspA family leucine-rich repeat surface protein [Leyella stercorea]